MGVLIGGWRRIRSENRRRLPVGRIESSLPVRKCQPVGGAGSAVAAHIRFLFRRGQIGRFARIEAYRHHLELRPTLKLISSMPCTNPLSTSVQSIGQR